MVEHAAHAVLPPDSAARVTEFARCCRAAARAVSLYPNGHPSIAGTLSRLAFATSRLTQNGPFAIQVHADQLVVAGGHLDKPDRAIPEVAALLHRHSVGALTLNAGADADSWRTLLLLLARAPEDVRADGGIAHLWATAGGPSIEVQEIDYTEVLREKQGFESTIEQVIAAALAGPQFDMDDGGMRALLDVLGDPSRLGQLLRELEQRTVSGTSGMEAHTAALLTLVRGLVEYVTRTEPERLDAIFDQLAQGVRHLSVESMISLLGARSRPVAMAGGINMVGALAGNMSDASVAAFVADAVVAERGATERLAHAFRSLVPDFDRQRQLLALAREEAAASDLGAEDGFAELWKRVEGMMTSYSDARYVSEEYARELSHARTQPTGVERTSDDPPERIAVWLATVSDAALRGLDQALLADLLAIEQDPLRWRDLAETVVVHADDLVRVGYFDQAWTLIEHVIEQSQRSAVRQPHAARALDRFARGSLTKHGPAHLRTADDRSVERFKRVAHAIGPPVIVPLAEALADEQDVRCRRRLRDILVGFGPGAAESVRPLMTAENWEVRRTAAYLMREFGGGASLKELVALLSDSEPLVRREAVQGLILNGTEEASGILARTLLDAKGRDRKLMLAEILGLRDDRATPLFSYVLRRVPPWQLPQLSSAAVEALGWSDSDEAIEALTAALHQGRWWTPLATRRWRAAAAHSLARIGTTAALDALRRTASRGPAGARAAARAELRRLTA